MATHEDIVRAWHKRLGDDTVRLPSTRNSNICIYGDTDVIYSYGTHFTLAEAIRDRKGKVRFILLNGDQHSVSTTRHQSIVRGIVRGSEYPTVTIPFTALDAARIDRKTIEILDLKPESYEHIRHESAALPADAYCLQETDWTEEIERRDDGKQCPDGTNCTEWNRRYMEDGTHTQERHRELYHQAWTGTGRYFHYTRNGSRDMIRHEWDKAAGEPMPEIWTHGNYIGNGIDRTDEGTWVWHTARHWLGDSLISAKTGRSKGKRVKFLSSFDRQESNRLYFLCQLPRTSAKTYEEAIEALKPETVKLAEERGRTVTRQGDMFAIPIPSITRDMLAANGATISATAKTVRLYGTSHTATRVATMPDGTQYAQGFLYHRPPFGRAPEHVRQQMGDRKVWHLIQKNTVPTH